MTMDIFVKKKFKIIIFVLVLLLLFVLAMPALNRLAKKPVRNRDVCLNNMSEIYSKMQLFAEKNDKNLLPFNKWCDLLLNDTNIQVSAFSCPNEDNRKIKSSYALNKYIEGREFSDLPDDIVVIFESDLGWNGVGGKNDVDFNNHDYRLESTSAGILQADGSVIYVTKNEIDSLRWE